MPTKDLGWYTGSVIRHMIDSIDGARTRLLDLATRLESPDGNVPQLQIEYAKAADRASDVLEKFAADGQKKYRAALQRLAEKAAEKDGIGWVEEPKKKRTG